MFVTVREDVFGEDCACFDSVGECTQKCCRENREWRWHQIKPIYMWSVDLVFKRLRKTNCLNP